MSLVFTNKVFMAPMAGITDVVFRQLCREQGAQLTYSEMVSGKSIIYGNYKQLLDTREDEKPWAVQLFGREPDILAEAARRVLEMSPVDLIDINMGCPAPKIVKNGEGSALMKEPALAGKIIKAVSRAIEPLPLTVKMRKGFTNTQITCVELAKIAEANGAAAVTVHGRSREQFYSGVADWAAIAAVKAAVNIPVVANGDINSPQAVLDVKKQTGCDAVMLARAALGNPWLFAEITRGSPPANIQQRIAGALDHCRKQIAFKGEHIGLLEMRKHLAWYVKSFPEAAKMRVQINKASSYAEFEEILNRT